MLFDTDSRAGTLVRAINDILIDAGPAGLTIRNISHVSGVSPSSIYGHLGSREHLLRVAAHQTGRKRLQMLGAESSFDGVLGFIPRTGDEVLDARAWLGWLELWRSEDYLEHTISQARYAELGLLASVTGYRLSRPALDAVAALVDGLLTALCSPRDPMRLTDARTILAAHLDVTPACHTSGVPRVIPVNPQPGR